MTTTACPHARFGAQTAASAPASSSLTDVHDPSSSLASAPGAPGTAWQRQRAGKEREETHVARGDAVVSATRCSSSAPTPCNVNSPVVGASHPPSQPPLRVAFGDRPPPRDCPCCAPEPSTARFYEGWERTSERASERAMSKARTETYPTSASELDSNERVLAVKKGDGHSPSPPCLPARVARWRPSRPPSGAAVVPATVSPPSVGGKSDEPVPSMAPAAELPGEAAAVTGVRGFAAPLRLRACVPLRERRTVAAASSGCSSSSRRRFSAASAS